jgi:hypothetical protein
MVSEASSQQQYHSLARSHTSKELLLKFGFFFWTTGCALVWKNMPVRIYRKAVRNMEMQIAIK